MQRYLPNFKNCLQKEVPFCQAACPFNLNVLDFIEKIKRGSFKAAFREYRNAVGFPVIVSHLCDAPCAQICPRNETDQAIDLHALERASLAFTRDTDPTDYNLPQKQGKIGIVGAGISGLSCALRLAVKKYNVVLYEKSERIGGHLWELLDSEIFLRDINKQFKFETYDLHLNTEVLSLEQLDGEGFDALYVATGAGGSDFGLNEAAPCFLYGRTGVFGGGSLLGKSTINAIADGLRMSVAIDNFLKTGNLIYGETQKQTAMCLEPSHLFVQPPVIPTDEGGAFTKEEAMAEAGRCMECQCDACRVHCDLTAFFNKWPLRIRDEIQATTLPGSAEVKATPAKRLISTCTQCGLCLETCPEDIDLGGLILAARHSMHQQQKTPWPFHDFWLRDMDFANGGLAAMTRAPTGAAACATAFFPGCQLGAGDPGLVLEAYQYLREQDPTAGLILFCCGVPAQWAGDEEKFQTVLGRIEVSWRALGEPVLLLACPACKRTFDAHLPHVPTALLYERMVEWGALAAPAGGVYSVFDPCASRGMTGVRDAIRALAAGAGVQLEPLARQEAYSRCCGYGGQGSIANPGFADFVAKKRIAEGEAPYLTYCINCRDVFRQAGKEAIHILELFFGGQGPEARPTISQRRENRILLKEALLKRFWDETMQKEQTAYDFELAMDDSLREKLNTLHILEEEMYNVVQFCEASGRTIYNEETDTYTGYRKIGRMTYWVEYRKSGDAQKTMVLLNAYCHRMEIELEVVWNGRKADLSMQ